MKKIVLSDVPYLRGTIASALVDESSLEFQNGLALAQANIVAKEGCRCLAPYDCWGVINESFREAYNDKLKVPGCQERNLMFLAYNRQIDRISADDFIVEVSCGDEGASFTEYRHIRIIEGVPTLIKKISCYQKTSDPNIIISGWKNKRLYDVAKGEYVTPEVLEISEAPTNDGSFNVTVRIETEEKLKYPFFDYLHFRIDKEGNIVSQVLSTLSNGSVDITGLSSIEELINWASSNLSERIASFYGAVYTLQTTNKFQYNSGLNRTRKNPDIPSEE